MLSCYFGRGQLAGTRIRKRRSTLASRALAAAAWSPTRVHSGVLSQIRTMNSRLGSLPGDSTSAQNNRMVNVSVRLNAFLSPTGE